MAATAEMPVRLSVRHTLVLYQNDFVMISSLSESSNNLVFADIRFVPNFERGHPERER